MLQISRMRQVVHQRLAWKVEAADVSDAVDVSLRFLATSLGRFAE